MKLEEIFPVWKQLTAEQQEWVRQSAVHGTVKEGTILHNGSADCVGLILVEKGQLRAYILSPEGKEITLYRLLDGDLCLFSASCAMNNIQFEITVEAQKDTAFWQIPTQVYEKLTKTSLGFSNYTNEILASRFSEVMWLMEQILWKSMDHRLASFLLEESALENTQTLRLTHDKIAAHLGTAREVVTRMLRYFQGEGLVQLTRGTVELTDPARLQTLAE